MGEPSGLWTLLGPLGVSAHSVLYYIRARMLPRAHFDHEGPFMSDSDTGTETADPVPGAPAESSGMQLGFILLIVIAVLGFVFGAVAIFLDDDDGGSGGEAAGGGAEAVLTEFAINPEPLAVGAGGTVQVANKGGIPHNLKVTGTEIGTDDINGGESSSFSVGDLSEGTYETWCDIAGHADSGMRGTLVVGAGGSELVDDVDLSAGDHGVNGTDWETLDAAMTDSIMEFPAETAGKGNEPLEFTVAEDGAKVFELTAEIVEWETEPGKFVEAWTYNGTVPGPWIKVNTGDLVRVELQNDLPMGTDIHWHGVQTPNEMDGVAPITQDLIEAGESFTYEFVAQKSATGMYHAHHHGQMQVPNGMFGVFQIDDTPLPLGQTVSGVEIPFEMEISQEIPMVLNDAGVIGYSLNGKSFPATEPYVADQGDWVQIHYYNEGLQIHPMHLHQFPQLIIAKDGIPLDQPYYADTINVAPGERYTVLANTTDPGTWVWHCHILNHVEREEGMFGMVTAFVVQ